MKFISRIKRRRNPLGSHCFLSRAVFCLSTSVLILLGSESIHAASDQATQVGSNIIASQHPPTEAVRIVDPIALIGQILREGDLNSLIPAGPLREGIKLRPLGEAEIVGLDTAVNVLKDEIRELHRNLSKVVGLTQNDVRQVREAAADIVSRIVGYEPHRSVVVLLNRGLLLDRVLFGANPDQVHPIADNLRRTLTSAEVLAVNLADKRGSSFSQIDVSAEYEQRAARSARLYLTAARQSFGSVDLRFAVNMLNLSLLMNDLFDSSRKLAFGKVISSLRARYQAGLDDKGALNSAGLNVYEKEQFNREAEKLIEEAIIAVSGDRWFSRQKYSAPHFRLLPGTVFRTLVEDRGRIECIYTQLNANGSFLRLPARYDHFCDFGRAVRGLSDAADLILEVRGLVLLRINSKKSMVSGIGPLEFKSDEQIDAYVKAGIVDRHVLVGWTGSHCAIYLRVADPERFDLWNGPIRWRRILHLDGTPVITDPRLCIVAP